MGYRHMREYIQIVESMMLREFMFAQGDPIQAMLDLNVFADLAEESLEDNPLDPKFVKSYQPTVEKMRERIESMPPIPLLPTMIDKLEREYYDGSDAYEEGFEEALGEIYDQQLKTCEEICNEMQLVLKDPTKAKDMVIRSILTTIKRNPGSSDMKHRMIKVIDGLRSQGYDFPELTAIEKSIRSEIDEETAKQAIVRGIRKGVKAGLVGSAIAAGMGGNHNTPHTPEPTNISIHMKNDLNSSKPAKITRKP